MHILIIPSWFPKNNNDIAGIFFRDQAEALKKYGHDIGIIAQYPISVIDLLNHHEKISSIEKNNNLIIFRSYFTVFLPKVPFGVFLLWYRVAKKQFIEYVKLNGKPEIIHAHSALYGGAIAVKIGQKYKIPVVITEHSSAYHLNLLKSWEVKLAQSTFLKANVCICVSHSLARQLNKIVDKNIIVISNVVAHRFFSEPIREAPNKKMIKILSIGSLDKNKRQAFLIEAFKLAHTMNNNLELLIVGNGCEYDNLTILSKNLSLENSISFLGSRTPDRIPYLISTVDIVVISSQYETFGVAAAEALAIGKPVISTECGGPQDIITNETGILTPVNNINAFAAAIIEIASNLKKYDSLKIRSYAIKKFSGHTISEQLTNIYRELLDKC